MPTFGNAPSAAGHTDFGQRPESAMVPLLPMIGLVASVLVAQLLLKHLPAAPLKILKRRIRIAEEERTELEAEATERDDRVPELQASAVGLRRMERYPGSHLQSPRSLSEAAYEAGHKDGYGDGYVDGYDDGQYNQLIGLIKELEDWMTSPIVEPTDIEGIYSVFLMLRERLEHGP